MHLVDVSAWLLGVLSQGNAEHYLRMRCYHDVTLIARWYNTNALEKYSFIDTKKKDLAGVTERTAWVTMWEEVMNKEKVGYDKQGRAEGWDERQLTYL